MKKLFTTIATAGLLTIPVYGQGQIQIQSSVVGIDGAPVYDKEPFVWVEKIAGGTIWYRENKRDSAIQEKRLTDIKAVYLSRPTEYVAALELFENRKYESALTAFRDFKKKYKFFTDIDNSFPALAGYYELACLRKLKQYEELAKTEPLFGDGKWLTQENHKDQLKIYKLWTHLADKAYPKVIKEYETNWLNKKLPSSLRAQVELPQFLLSLRMMKRFSVLESYGIRTRLSFFNHYLILQHSLG